MIWGILFLLLMVKPAIAGDVNQTKFGIFYSIWHCPEVNIWPQHFGGIIPDITEILAGRQQWGSIPSFHYWGRPQLGYYCLADREDVLRTHAKQLREAGIDFVFLDITNQSNTDNDAVGSKGRIQDPLIKMLQVWNTIPDAPKIVPWVRNDGGNMMDWVLNTMDQYPNLQFNYQGKPLVFAGFGIEYDVNKLVQLSSRYTFRMMKGLGDYTMRNEFPNWFWVHWCEPQDSFRSSQGRNDCNQKVATVNGQVEEVPVAAAYQETYMSRTDSATGKFDGKTLQKQFKTLFNNQGVPIVLIVAWNEMMAQRLCFDNNGNLTGDSSKCGNDNKIFVDDYNMDYSRDIEPAENQKGDLYYKIMKACIQLYKSGGRCDGSNENNLCCNTPTFINGYVDRFSCNDAAGWGKDDRNGANKLKMKVEVYPENEPQNKIVIGGTENNLAQSVRSDLKGICGSDGACAYGVPMGNFPASFKDKKLRMHVFGIATDGIEMEINFQSSNQVGPCSNVETITEVAGDADGDQKVTILDFAIWRQEFVSKQGTTADFDDSGSVTILDFARWRGEFVKN